MKVYHQLIILLFILSCSADQDDLPKAQCEDLFEPWSKFDSTIGTFSIKGKDLYATGKFSNSFGGVVHNGEGLTGDIDIGELYIDSLQAEKKVSGYGIVSVESQSQRLKEIWGKQVTLRFTGNPEQQVLPVAQQVYIPKVLMIELELSGQKIDKNNYPEPEGLGFNDELNITWVPDSLVSENIEISISYLAEQDYKSKQGKSYCETVGLMDEWTPKGRKKESKDISALRIMENLKYPGNGLTG